MENFFSRRKADAVGNGAFLIGLALMIYYNSWWPWIFLALWVSVGLRQMLTGRYYDLLISSAILLGLFFLSLYRLDLSILAPVLLIVGGVFIIFREFFFTEDTNGEEKSKEIKDDIEDSK